MIGNLSRFFEYGIKVNYIPAPQHLSRKISPEMAMRRIGGLGGWKDHQPGLDLIELAKDQLEADKDCTRE